jgi:hypothetical protein
MISKKEYTKIFLESAGAELTDKLLDAKNKSWWWNLRDKSLGGLRLTEDAIAFIEQEAKIKTYKVPFPDNLTITPQVLIWLDNFIESPYFITKRDITVLKEKSAFELYLFSGDVRKMGYGKAMAKRAAQD